MTTFYVKVSGVWVARQRPNQGTNNLYPTDVTGRTLYPDADTGGVLFPTGG